MKKLPALLMVMIFGTACDKPATSDSAAVASPYSNAVQTGAVTGMRMKNESAQDASATQMAVSQGPAAPPAGEQIKTGQFTGVAIAPAMIIRNGDATIEVDKVDAAIVKVRQLATQLGGYVANSSISGGREQTRQAMLELKIPASRYDQAINGLGNIGNVETVNSTAQDVGEEFVDISARVANARRLEDRLVALLATRTGKLDEVLRVERELARIREEIERYEGRLRYLTTRVAISTLNITVHEPISVLGGTPGDNPIAAALRRAWQNFVAFVAGFIALLGVLVPLAALAVVGWLLFRRIRRVLQSRSRRDDT